MLLLFMAKFEAKEHLKKLDQHATFTLQVFNPNYSCERVQSSKPPSELL